MICKNTRIYCNFMFLCISLMLTLVQANYLEENFSKNSIEDATLDTVQLLQKYQYPAEVHYVETKDKYILGLHRIPKPGAPPVFLMHGLQDSSAGWIITGVEKALGYYLSDSGYDVWLGNARGNRYSRNHTLLNPNTNPEFWKFSWHEIGFYDLPAMIDYVLEQTGYNKTGYFGHSQGTTSFWVLCSMRPEYNEKITMMHALAPTAFMKHLKSPILQLGSNFIRIFDQQITEFLFHNPDFYKVCLQSEVTKDLIMLAFYLFVGGDDGQFNMDILPAFLGHLPAGASFGQVNHYSQMIKSARFCQYDYGVKENLKRFGTPYPPDYPLEKITVPVGLYYAYNDYCSDPVDVKKLSKILPNVVEDYLFPDKKWNHVTVIWGNDARKLAHKRMLKNMKNYPYT